jgi:hypothetical protein
MGMDKEREQAEKIEADCQRRDQKKGREGRRKMKWSSL